MKALAQQFDKHHLYEAAVQCVEAEIDMVDASFAEIRGHTASTLREDFCGTAQTSAEWVRRRASNQGMAVDLDPAVLQWAKQNTLANLSSNQHKRLVLLESDVKKVAAEPVQIILAMNFSYQIFQNRDSLRDYFIAARSSLDHDGVLFLDAYGGYDSYREITEETACELPDGTVFTYIWQQASYNPIDGEMQCYIHFEFEDGSRQEQAFSYKWRLWTLPELQELLLEAGFDEVTVYWEGTDEETGEGDGCYTPSKLGDADASWICYLSAHNH